MAVSVSVPWFPIQWCCCCAKISSAIFFRILSFAFIFSFSHRQSRRKNMFSRIILLDIIFFVVVVVTVAISSVVCAKFLITSQYQPYITLLLCALFLFLRFFLFEFEMKSSNQSGYRRASLLHHIKISPISMCGAKLLKDAPKSVENSFTFRFLVFQTFLCL